MIRSLSSITKMQISPFIKLTENGTAAIIQLNRPQAHNAIDKEMWRNLYDITKNLEHKKSVIVFKGSGKVFCCGGDVKGIVSSTLDDLQSSYQTSSRTYDLIKKYKIPFVVLIDGLAMGGAAIFATSGRYRVATERTVFAMPETAIGYFNDAASSYFLPRIPHNFGIYIGMTGERVKGFDMKKIGLATHYIESFKLDEVEENLIYCRTHEEVERTLSKYSSDPTSTETKLDTIMPRIENCFGATSVEEIYENLRKDGSEWALKTLKTLDKMSPTSLKVTHRSMNLGRNLSLRDCLRMECRLVTNFSLGSEMKEGVRALLIDKDLKPKWNPSSINDVTEEHVAKFFRPSAYDFELTFETNCKNKL